MLALPCSIMMIIVMVILGTYISGYAEAHFSTSNKRIQELIDRADMIRIQFLYQPEMPIIDEFTELQFSIQNMSTGEHIKDLTGRGQLQMARDYSNFKI